MNDQARMIDSATFNENRIEQQKNRITQLERIEIDLERQLNDSLAEVNDMRT